MSDPVDPLQRTLDHLLQILALEPDGDDRFVGQNEPDRVGRLFGGQVIGQALRAASYTIDTWLPHSLHAYFLKGGHPDIPVTYEVHRVRDGRSFGTRRVLALQEGEAILNLAASFHKEEAGLEHQIAMPEAPPPEDLESFHSRLRRQSGRTPFELKSRMRAEPPPVDSRPLKAPSFLIDEPGDGTNMTWMRVPRRLPDDPLLHRCLVAYMSDMAFMDVIAQRHPQRRQRAMMASLDHAVWFHGDMRADEWLLFVQDSPVARGARGMARGMLFTRDNRLVATVAQEGLARVITEDRHDTGA